MKKHQVNDDDIVFESEGESGVVNFDKKIKKLKEDLHKCQEEKAQYLDGWQRSQADFINYKKRADNFICSVKYYGFLGGFCPLFPPVALPGPPSSSD